MSTYYLNDPTSNWNIKTNVLQNSYNNNMALQVSDGGKLSIRKNDSLVPEKYTELKIGDIYLYLTTYTNAFNNYSSVEMVNDIIYLKTSITTNYAMAIGTSIVDILKPICSSEPSSVNQLVNKLYVDNPIQQANAVKGGSNIVSNIPKFLAYDGPTMYNYAGYNQGGLLYPTKNITITGLSSSTYDGVSNGSVNQMWLVSFPSLTSNFATVIAKCSNSNFWKSTYTSYASLFTEAPSSVTLLKGNKYGIIIYSNSTTSFTLRGIANNYSFFTNPSQYDVQTGGTYTGTANKAIGDTFTLDSNFAFQTPYVVAYGP